MATSKRSLRIEIDPSLLEDLRTLSKPNRQEIGQRIEEVRQSFGNPHVHGGVGIRELRDGVYECRVGLQQRLVFSLHKGYLYFRLLGNHNDVVRFLRHQ